ncbi:hypothetical protein RPALISO_168 [Ruegeria phage RpAliso]|nr:hypothetical protein RPALISO_168 [Ruegeria phage RpAliso]
MSFGARRPRHPLEGTRWRHKKRGTIYEVVRVATKEDDMTARVIYEDHARVWDRDYDEFMDGRFEQLPEQHSPNLCSEIALPKGD